MPFDIWPFFQSYRTLVQILIACLSSCVQNTLPCVWPSALCSEASELKRWCQQHGIIMVFLCMLALSSHFVGWEVILSCKWLLQKSATEVVSHGFRNLQMRAFGNNQTWNAALLCQWPWESRIHVCRKNIKMIVLNWACSLLPDVLSPERSQMQIEWEKIQ